ncbi:MAG: saccharopine dehydrogenase NADP-binding domain-containing protein [Desulfobacterales bacterium]
MSRVLIIGAGGGVGQVVVHKCAQVPEVLRTFAWPAGRLKSAKKIAAQLNRPIQTARVDADNVPELVALIQSSSRTW